jgi:hypothetical protein
VVDEYFIGSNNYNALTTPFQSVSVISATYDNLGLRIVFANFTVSGVDGVFLYDSSVGWVLETQTPACELATQDYSGNPVLYTYFPSVGDVYSWTPAEVDGPCSPRRTRRTPALPATAGATQ